jgi:lysophospholipid acyltransferase (LPLAT)-like uncharacterized protein
MRWTRTLLGWIAGVVLLLLRMTCRYRVFTDPRPDLRLARRPYIYALLHAHQVNAVFINDDRCMTAMVSRSADGDLLVPALKLRRVTAIRGSSRSRARDKGGRVALKAQAEYLRAGVPALLAVDGPRGPRNFVHRGVADLAMMTGAVVLPVVVVPTRRWILQRTWDRFQIPKPLCTINMNFAPPIEPDSFDSAEALAARVGELLDALETAHDPVEAHRLSAHSAGT